jgi:hypothetical protein
LGVSQYKAFIQTYFIDIPKYQGLLFNYPVPNVDTVNFPTWLPLIIASLAIMMLVVLIRNEYRKKNFSRQVLLAFVLLFGGIFFLRAGYGRSDWGHIAYSTPLLFIAAFYITYLFVSRQGIRKEALWMPATLILLLFIPYNTVAFGRLTDYMHIDLRATANYLHLRAAPDSQWLPKDVADTTAYVKQHTAASDPIFVFTQQPIYYYLTNRENPTRFYIPWFADPKLLENEALKSLEKKKPALIVYSSGNGWDHVDGFSMKERTPQIEKWIQDNYPNKVTIGNVTLLTKKDAPAPAQ